MSTPARTVLLADPDRSRWVLAGTGPWVRLRAALQAPVLDAQLAAGRPASTDHARAVRAARLVDPAYRRRLAAYWEAMLTRANGPHRVAVLRDRVAAAEDEIHEMTAALRLPQPVPVRGVALATTLLTDGISPLYHRPSRKDLRAEVHRAVRHLDPTLALLDELR
jgi:hypothetical protein